MQLETLNKRRKLNRYEIYFKEGHQDDLIAAVITRLNTSDYIILNGQNWRRKRLVNLKWFAKWFVSDDCISIRCVQYIAIGSDNWTLEEPKPSDFIDKDWPMWFHSKDGIKEMMALNSNFFAVIL